MLREQHRQEIAVRAGAGAAGLRHPQGGGRAVMPVRDIEGRQGIGGARQRRDRRLVADRPELMAHAVVGGDVHLGRTRGGFRQHGVDVGSRRIGDHDRAGLRVDGLDLMDPVVFLDRGRELMLADAVGGVIGERSRHREPGLGAVAPGQPVNVIARLGIADHDAGRDHALEIFGRLGIDRRIVRIDRGIEIDLGLRDMQEAPRLAFGAQARLRAREHVIGGRQDLGGAPGSGPQRTEGLNERQEASPQHDRYVLKCPRYSGMQVERQETALPKARSGCDPCGLVAGRRH